MFNKSLFIIVSTFMISGCCMCQRNITTTHDAVEKITYSSATVSLQAGNQGILPQGQMNVVNQQLQDSKEPLKVYETKKETGSWVPEPVQDADEWVKKNLW